MNETRQGANVQTSKSSRLRRAADRVAWYTPELAAAGVAALAAHTVWAPLWAVSAGAGAFIVADVVIGIHGKRAARKAERLRADQARLDTATDTSDSTETGDGTTGRESGWEVAG